MKIVDYTDAEEFYAPFVRAEGRRGTVLLFKRDEEATPEELALAAELGAVLDGEERKYATSNEDGEFTGPVTEARAYELAENDPGQKTRVHELTPDEEA